MICSDHVICSCHVISVTDVSYLSDQLPYSFSSRLGNNVSNITSNVNFSPTTLNQLDDFPLVDYSVNNVCINIMLSVCHYVYGICHCVYGICHSVYGICHYMYMYGICEGYSVMVYVTVRVTVCYML